MVMLPSFFVDQYLTLEKDKQRIAFCMDLSVYNDTIMDVSFKNVIINVSHNYTYEDKKLLKKKEYKSLFNKVQILVDNKKNIASTTKMNVSTSRDLVEYLMITMNYQVALFTRKYSTGIYKAIPQPNLREYSEEFIQNSKMMEYMKRGKFGPSKYITFAQVEDGDPNEKSLYLPITSPIRKLVDLINLTITQQVNNVVVVSRDATEFCNTWSEKLDVITQYTKETKQLEYECKLLKTCSDNVANEYDGVIVDIITEKDTTKYTVYLPELEVSLRMKSMKTDVLQPNKGLLGSSNRYKLYLFEKETTLVKKIRLALKT
jgi:exoribonuclease R